MGLGIKKVNKIFFNSSNYFKNIFFNLNQNDNIDIYNIKYTKIIKQNLYFIQDIIYDIKIFDGNSLFIR